MEPLTKVLVIGVDGGEPEIFADLMRRGEAPNLAALQARGLTGRTANPYGLEAGAVWPTFHTGLRPGRQPQYDGLRHFDRERYAARWYEREETAPNLWKLMSDAGARVLVVDPPYARLDTSLNGAMILDWGGHVPSDGQHMHLQTHPAELRQEIIDVVGPDPTGGEFCDRRKLESLSDYRAFTHDYLERIKKKSALSTHLLRKGGWDYAEIVFTDLHCTGHHLWHIHDVHHPKHDARLRAAMGDPLIDCYRAFDRALGEILATVDDRTQILFFTSHGMGPQYTGTGLLDRMLDQLERREPVSARAPVKATLTKVWHSVPGEIRAKLRPLRKHVKGALTYDRFLPNPASRRFFEVYANNAAGGVRVNLVGREAEGVVPREAYEALLDSIAEDLIRFKNAETGEPLILDCVKTHARYDGDHLDSLPDLLVVWNRSSPIRTVVSPFGGTMEQVFGGLRTGDHTPEGMFIACGRGVEPISLNHPVNAEDFAPTIAGLLGVELSDTDGSPIAALSLGAR